MSSLRTTILIALLAGCGTSEETTPDSGGGGVTATFTSLYGSYFMGCNSCHAPGAPGRTSDIEQTLDFTSKATAYSTLKMSAAGLMGNFQGCNGTPFIGPSPANSVILAVVDQSTRNAFDWPDHPDCNMDSIPDETRAIRGGAPPSGFVTALSDWISAGAPNN